MCVSEKSQGSLGLSRRIWRSILVRGTVVVLRITCGLGVGEPLVRMRVRLGGAVAVSAFAFGQSGIWVACLFYLVEDRSDEKQEGSVHFVTTQEENGDIVSRIRSWACSRAV